MAMRIGVDFDNTLVCYDGLFHAAATARGLMPQDAPRDKQAVRRWFLERGREEDFTLLQGEVYGPGLRDAPPYSGARECLAGLKAKGAAICLVSHKTPTPVLGPQYDLRAAAREWLEANGFVAPGIFAAADLFFEDTMHAKAARIAELGCTHFIDDMERFLSLPEFPPCVERLWFRPSGEDSEKTSAPGLTIIASWEEAAVRLGAAL